MFARTHFARLLSGRAAGAGAFALAALSVVACAGDTSQPTGTAQQAVVNPPLPPNLNLAVNAKTSLTVGAFAQVFGDVGATGPNGSVLFDVSSSQGCCSGNVLANTVTVNLNASVGHVYGNDVTIDGFAQQRSLGLDPAALPQVPAAALATPGTTNISTKQNQTKQLCPGQYGAISLGVNSVLNLNGGVYQVSRLTLADGARLEPSEPVVILVSGGVTTGIGSVIRPSDQSLNPMSAAEIRIEVGGAVTIGDNSQIRAHVLTNGKFTLNKGATLLGAVWGKTISLTPQSFVSSEGAFAVQTPAVPPPCNDNNACTTDVCVGNGTSATFCRNTPAPSGTSCDDGQICNGVATCDGFGACQPGSNAEAGTSCADGDACNGDEACNGFGSCLGGTPPDVNDRNACTTDACDPATGVSHVPVDDGTTCSGIGVCQGGVCSVQGAVFSDNYFQFQSPTGAQCDSWNLFRATQLTNGTYNSVTFSGSFDPFGVTCSDPAAATQICQALHNGSFASVFCNGHSWKVGECGGIVFDLDADICFCDFGAGHAIRPCIFNENWGGVNTATCGAPSQNITISCQ